MRSQLETRIAAALTNLSAEDMQRVAEDYARIRFPDRFPRFDFRAFSEEGKARKGWPDAWIDVDGCLDGVEAFGPKTMAAVRGHMEEDLKKARDRTPALSGLVIVSGHPAVQPTPEELVSWRQRFINEAGIAPERLEIMFGGGLVEALARPEFARTRIEVLRVPDLPRHFKLVHAKRGPDQLRLSAFTPSDKDFAAGRVHRPAAANEVLAQLKQHRCALVRGVGASGKSVMGWLFALEAAEQRRPAYLLDLAEYVNANPDTGNALAEDLNRFCHPNALFVLDNCHLEESLAKEVVLAWEALVPSQQPEILLLGRELRTSRGSLIDGLQIEPIALRSRQPEVRGVYLRLAQRHCGEAQPPDPPLAVLNDWVGTFGGDPRDPNTTTDLIAFSAAVLRRMPFLLKGNWVLSEADAVEEVRQTYLDKLSVGETRNLIRLCAIQELEVAISDRALADRSAHFEKTSRQLGLVFQEKAGIANQWTHYRLAHAALSNLILAASHNPVDAKSERLAISLQDPFIGTMLVYRLWAAKSTVEGRALASAMLGHPRDLVECGGVMRLHMLSRGAQRLGVSLPHGIGKALIEPACRKLLTEQALQMPLGQLANSLAYFAKSDELRVVFRAIAEDLAKLENRKPLIDRTLQTPPDHLAKFLEYAAKSHELRPVFRAVAESLAKLENRKTLTARALQKPLNQLAIFLSYLAESDELQPVFRAVAEDLAKLENRRPLIDRALQTPLDNLAQFLEYAASTRNVRPVFEELAKDLVKPENRKQLIKRALQTRLDQVANFLEYCENSEQLRPVFEALVEDLANPENRRHLVSTMAQQSLDASVRVLTSNTASDVWNAVFAEVDLSEWESGQREPNRSMLGAFVPFSRIAEQKGRPELAEALARTLMVKSPTSHWHTETNGLHHLSNVIRQIRGMSRVDTESFLQRIATPEWIDGLVNLAPTGALAGTLLSLGLALEPKLHSYFARPALLKRVKGELTALRGKDSSYCGQVLSLLGAASVVGASGQAELVSWPTAGELSEILRLRSPEPDKTTIRYFQAQLWYGLREMARLRKDSVVVEPHVANQILNLWETSADSDAEAALLPHVRVLNTGMVAWLHRCKASGWCLVSPDVNNEVRDAL